MLRLADALPLLRRARSARALSSSPAAFDGEVSRLYAHLFEQHTHARGPWVKMLAAVRDAVPPGRPAAILDLATGPGEPAASIARERPEVTVWATDVSGDMLAKARSRMAHMPNARFAQVDMQDLSRFEDGTFDVVTACYAFMFPRDKPRALREALRVLKPGGQLIATNWTELALFKLLQQTMAGVLGGTPPPPEINPLCLAPDGMLDQMLQEAGFGAREYRMGAYPFDLGEDTDMQASAFLLSAHAIPTVPPLDTPHNTFSPPSLYPPRHILAPNGMFDWMLL
jgi:SAM-dependent methyltransferase